MEIPSRRKRCAIAEEGAVRAAAVKGMGAVDFRVGDRLVESRGTEVVIREFSPDPDGVLEFTARVPPGGGLLPEHAHPAQIETFRITSGSARYRLNGVDGTAAAGTEIRVAAGTRHVNPWNPSGEVLEFVQRVTPVLDFPAIAQRLGFRKR
jgi:quercetin dioxygenase-like cupin family protein